MKKFLILILTVLTLTCFALGSVGCGDKTPEVKQLSTPTLTANGTELSWTAVDNASGYVFKINGQESTLPSTQTTYSLATAGAGTYTCTVKAIGGGNWTDSAFSLTVSVTIDGETPVINSTSNVYPVFAKNDTIELCEDVLSLEIQDDSDYTLSYKVKYNGETPVTLNGNSFVTAEYGFYDIEVTATDEFGNFAIETLTAVVNGTYYYSFNQVTDITAGEDWFVRNSSNGGSTTAEIVEDGGNKYYKFTATAGEITTFNMPLPDQKGLSVVVGKSYKAYIKVWTDATLSGSEKISFSSVAPMVNAGGQLDSSASSTVLTADFTAGEKRISTFYLVNETAKEVVYYMDYIMLAEVPVWEDMPVDIEQGTDEVDENGNLKSVFSRADSKFKFYPSSIANNDANDMVKVTLKYKIVSNVPMADNRGALGSYDGGTLFLTANSIDFLTVTFDTKVQAGATPFVQVVFITAVGATMYIDEFTVEPYPEWSEMPVDTVRATDDVDENGNFKAVFARADAEFYFYPSELEGTMAGDTVLVTLKYKIQSTEPMADNRGALGSHKGGTLFLTANSTEFLTETFEAVVEGDTPCIKIIFITVAGATMYIEEFGVEANVEKQFGFFAREVDLGLGGNTIYMLPSSTGMQTLSMIIQNTQGEIFVIDGGYDSNVWQGEDAKIIFDVVSALSGQNEKVIKGWFLTHPHADHIGAFIDFTSTYGSQVTIETVYYSWPEEESFYTDITANPDPAFSLITQFKQSIPTGTNVVNPKTGDTFDFGSFGFKILYSPANDNYNFSQTEKVNFNNLSLVIKMTTSEKSILFLADAGVGAGEWLIDNVSSTDLKADIVQMAHHGQAGVNQDVYQAIDPDIALWNCDKAVYENSNGKLQTLVVRGWMEQLGTTNYVSKDGLFIFN